MTQTNTRTEVFPCDGPAMLAVQIRAGRLEVRTADVQGIRVRISVDRGEGSSPGRGFEDAPGEGSNGQAAPSAADDHVVGETKVSFSEEHRRLVIRAPRTFRRVQLAVSIEAPERSRLAARLHRGSVIVSGMLGELNAATGAGDIRAERIEGTAEVATSSGDIRLGRVGGRLRARSGSGEIEATSLDGEAKVATGSGDVWLGVVHSNVHARTGSGSVAVAEVAGGRLDLLTGSGNVNVSVRPGVAAEIDLVSGSGQTRSELDVLDRPPADAPTARIRARTGSGEAVVARTPA